MSQLSLFTASLVWTIERPTRPGHYLYWMDGRSPNYLICTTRFGEDMKNFQGRTPSDFEGEIWWHGPVELPAGAHQGAQP